VTVGMGEEVLSDEILSLIGWSRDEITHALSPPKSPQSTALSLAGWSPKSFLEIFSAPVPIKEKRPLLQSPTQDSRSKQIDLKHTPTISNCSIHANANHMDLSSLVDRLAISTASSALDTKEAHGQSTQSQTVDKTKQTYCPTLIDLHSTLPNGWKLYSFQREVVCECIRLERVILALDMGLGINYSIVLLFKP
jgi:hypothetical protein